MNRYGAKTIAMWMETVRDAEHDCDLDRLRSLWKEAQGMGGMTEVEQECSDAAWRLECALVDQEDQL